MLVVHQQNVRLNETVEALLLLLKPLSWQPGQLGSAVLEWIDQGYNFDGKKYFYVV